MLTSDSDDEYGSDDDGDCDGDCVGNHNSPDDNVVCNFVQILPVDWVHVRASGEPLVETF